MRAEIESLGDAIRVEFPDELIAVTCDRWYERNGTATVEAAVETSAPGVSPHIHLARLNLTSTRARKDFAKHCQGRFRGPDWDAVLEHVAVVCLERRRLGEPLLDLATEPASPRTYRLSGWVPDHGTTVIYADGGTAKSILALYLAGCVQRGEPFLGVVTRQGTVLYVDYEEDKAEQARRLREIARGMEWTDVPQVLYHSARAPITESGPEIRYLCDRHHIDFVIVDSLGYAGAASNDPEPVMAAHRVLRSLGHPVLAIHHVAKNERGERSPFGSAYHRNSARSCIEVRRIQEPGAASIYVGLYQTKLNIGRLQPPLGAHVLFADGATIFRPVDPGSVAGLAEGIPLTVRVLDLLKHGAVEPMVLVEELDVEKVKLGSLLRKLKHGGKVVKLADGRWGLPA